MSIPKRGQGRKPVNTKGPSGKARAGKAPVRSSGPEVGQVREDTSPVNATEGGSSAALLAIGDEVLRGEIMNTNAAFLSNRLFDAGFEMRSQLVVSDEPQAIFAALQRLASEVSVLVVTGGLGPTEDDRTVDVVADLLGVETELDAPSLEAMKKRFSAHGFEMTPNNLRQVRVPRGAEALPNAAGIAPGFGVKLGSCQAFFLPGVPREMERIFVDHVAPRLHRYMADSGKLPAAVRTWHLYGMGESHIDHRLAGLLEGVENATLHFRTAFPENHVKVVIRGSDRNKIAQNLEQVDQDLRKRIGAGVYGIDDETFPRVVGNVLRGAGATLALAESCTGGEAGELITSEPGASDFFLGGVMAYANDVKINVLGVKEATLAEHGAVSEPCAKEMAEGVKKITGATVAVSITGIAGSSRDGWEPSAKLPAGEKPVGTVCFALAGPKSTKTVTKLFPGGRERIRRAAAYFALDLARRQFA